MDIIINTYNRSLYHKNYVRLTSNYGNEICNFYKEMTCITEYKIDGLIFISVGNSYIKTTQYKWKPVSTIDFIAKKCIPELLGIHPYISKECKTLYLLFSGISSYDYEKIGLKKLSIITRFSTLIIYQINIFQYNFHQVHHQMHIYFGRI